MNFGRCSTQQMCLLSWRQNWTTQQKDSFNQTVLEEYLYSDDHNDIMEGLGNLDLSGNGSNMFPCQLRLFRAWYKSWSLQERQTFLRTLANIDPTFIQFMQVRNVVIQL